MICSSICRNEVTCQKYTTSLFLVQRQKVVFLSNSHASLRCSLKKRVTTGFEHWTRAGRPTVCTLPLNFPSAHAIPLVVFLGINDCGTTECDGLESIVETLFDALHNLYVKAGARNFVLIDVPPIDRSPQGMIA